MARVVGKLEDGRELRGFDLQGAEVKAISDDEIEIIGSTADKDRDGEVIDVSGWDMKNYKKNPVILPAHDYRQPAIGKATSVKVKDGKLIFKVKFPPEGDNPLADVYRKLYKGGFMSASSVGFAPSEWVDGDGKGKNPYRTYTKSELLELSLVSVPANPNALVTAKGVKSAVEKGVLNADDVEILKNYAQEAMKGAEDEQKEDDPGGEGQEEVTPPAAEEQGDTGAGEGEGQEENETEKLWSEVKRLTEEVKTLKDEIGELQKPKSYLDEDINPGEAETDLTQDELKEMAKGVFLS